MCCGRAVCACDGAAAAWLLYWRLPARHKPMAALIVVVSLALTVAYWLFTPLTVALAPLVEGHLLPWLLLAGLIWLLAGQPAREP